MMPKYTEVAFDMTLTDAARYTRRAVKYTIFLLLLFTVGGFLWKTGVGVYRHFFPPPPPPPTVAFGKLPALTFPSREGLPKLSFSLQTTTGELPSLPATANVYFMPQEKSSFLALENASRIARNLDFTGARTGLSETVYRFESPNAPRTLDMNIVTKVFSINYDVSQTPELLSLQPRSTEEALSSVTSFLSRANLYTEDLRSGNKTFEFLKVQSAKLIPAISLSESIFIKVNLFRGDYDSLPVLTPQKTGANVWFYISGDRSRNRQIIGGEYHYYPVEENQKSTYPLKTAEQAWNDLVSGKAFITIPASGGGSSITIRRIYLAYYDSGEPAEFLQPIVVFEGDEGFTAYVPAVTMEYYGVSEESQL